MHACLLLHACLLGPTHCISHALQDGLVLEQSHSSLQFYGNLTDRGGLWSLAGSSCKGRLRAACTEGLLHGPILELFALDKPSLLGFLEVGASSRHP